LCLDKQQHSSSPTKRHQIVPEEVFPEHDIELGSASFLVEASSKSKSTPQEETQAAEPVAEEEEECEHVVIRRTSFLAQLSGEMIEWIGEFRKSGQQHQQQEELQPPHHSHGLFFTGGVVLPATEDGNDVINLNHITHFPLPTPEQQQEQQQRESSIRD